MNVLHIVAGDLTGGAARGAYWLHKGLIELGVNSKIFTNSKTTLGYENIMTLTSKKDKAINILSRQFDKLLLFFYPNRKRIIFSSGLFGLDFTKKKEYKEADIIHLHWINGGLVNIKHLSKIDKPIVWTMRDMWPMTGGCHYPMDCQKYKTGCGSCKQLESYEYDLSKFILNRKIKYLPKNIKLIGISHWLSDKARESKLFKKVNIQTISNNINTKEFFPVDKKLAREILGIKTEKNIILVGSTNLKDFYKGFGKFQNAVKSLGKEKYFLCFFGNINKRSAEELGFDYKSFGYLNDNISLRLVYSCADVFVAPSLMDAFGKTIAEAMACGTPTVCFDATGPKDIVDHKINGYKAKPFESDDLADGIKWILNSSNYFNISQNAINKVKTEFDNVVIAQKYIKLYKELLS
jgi:glycosyltransferase involved in cell wall biosynthesis